MRFEALSFGSIRIDGVTYEKDVVIDRGKVCKRDKKPSKAFRDQYGHTPLSIEENIPWKCRRLVIGTGGGTLPDQLVDDRWPADVRRLVRRVLRGAIAETVRAVDDAQAEELRKIVDDGHEAIERLQALDMSELRRRVRELQAARASLDEAPSFGIARLPELDATALGQLEHPDRLAP